MTIQEIEEITINFLSEEFEVASDLIRPESDLKSTLDLDSLDYVDLVVLIDEHFHVKLSGEDFKSVETFSDFYQLIHARLGVPVKA